MTFSLDDRVGAVEASEVLVVVVAAEGDGHLAADGGVPDGGQGCCIAAVDPALFKVPQGGNNEVVFPGWGKSVLCSTRLQLQIETKLMQSQSSWTTLVEYFTGFADLTQQDRLLNLFDSGLGCSN